MKTYYGFDDIKIIEKTSIMIGKFDGVHLGHRLLLDKLMEEKAKGHKSVVITFDVPPNSLKNNTSVKMLTPNDEKKALFERYGVDFLIICPFTKEVMGMHPKEFLELLFNKMNIKSIICGSDFCFGHNRAGNTAYLDKVSKDFGFRLFVVDKLISDGVEISSTLIRSLLKEGKIEKANELLGYKYSVSGKVSSGNQIGRTIGFPTVNVILDENKLAPKYGVYSSEITVDGKTYKGISNIGVKPTVNKNGNNDEQCSLEMNIFEFNDYIYEKDVVVYLNRYIREERKFESIDELKKQIAVDISSVKEH
ncbi:MAG: bifunctional riboflavin kinase/FAD synthetase [Lachnospiraceae bacterium]|nr:bifunctional riboflavin kinase/FAD synthetase [Lachnospiraceae bacterium]